MGFAVHLLGLLWGRKLGDLRWDLAGLPVPPELSGGIQQARAEPPQWVVGAGWAPGGKNRALGGLQPSSRKQCRSLTGQKAVAICRR